MRHFSVESEGMDIPSDAEAESTRLLKVNWKGRAITGLSQSAYRSYVYPVLTPAGVAVTTERSVSDHPWHQSVTIGTDYFFTYQQSPTGKIEEPPLNFYWDWKFQGRNAGRIVSVADNEITELAENHLQITQRLRWQSPEEWGEPPYRRILIDEMRTIDIYPGDVANIIDVRSRLRPTYWDVRIGPCRHAYFTIRVADHLRVMDPQGNKIGGTLTASDDRTGQEQICWQLADWIDFSGKDTAGRRAGIALFQFPSLGNVPWYVINYGSIRINPFRLDARNLNRGDMVDVAIRIVAHDGDAREAGVADLYESFKRQTQRD